jgi:hypothetical protein
VDFVFTTTGERAVSGISKAKERLDKRMLELLRAALTNTGEDAGQIAVGEWTLPDLRRTAATGYGKAQYRLRTSSTASSTRFGLGSGRSRFAWPLTPMSRAR